MPRLVGGGCGLRWLRVAVATLCLAAAAFGPARACSPGRSAMSRYESQKSTPLVFKQFVPNRAENSLSASGQTEGPITRDSPRFKELVENHNLDIVFKDEEGTGADRLMSQRCKDKLNSLAVMVMNQWPGVKLRVTESWDEDGAHADDSLHYEGRAVDLTTSDKDRSKLGMLARLAIDAGFDYVFYESKNHIHCSVKSDKSLAVGSGGCFSGSSSVRLANGNATTMDKLRIGDKVLAADSTGRLFYDEIYAFLDRQHGFEDYYVLQTEGNDTIAVTGMHLLFVQASSGSRGCSQLGFSDSAVKYARDVDVGDSLYVTPFDVGLLSLPRPSRVTRITVQRKLGLYAPATLGGTIVVDDVLASCYAVVNSHVVAHAALTPLRFAHRLQQAAAPWLHWLASETMVAAGQDHSQDDNQAAGEVSIGVHWYAQLMFTATRSLAGDLLFT